MNKKIAKSQTFKSKLIQKMDSYVHFIYEITRKFPKEELFGSTTQIRRATLSIILNYIEGYARNRHSVQLNFFEISYGSLKESKYLLYFAYTLHWIDKNTYDKGLTMVEEIGAMLWTDITNLKKYHIR